VIQLTDQRMGEAVALGLFSSSFNGRTIGSLPDDLQQIEASTPGCGLFYKWSMDLGAPVIVRCTQADVRRK
jgi:hypothetical protein